jgi:SPP1 family predicted phage head-tail adaptor
MRTGDMTKTLLFQAPTKDANGLVGWATVFTAKGALWPTSASEQIKNMATVMTISHRIRIRYRPLMKPNWRVKFGNRNFAIVSIVNVGEANQWLDILTKEAV